MFLSLRSVIRTLLEEEKELLDEDEVEEDSEKMKNEFSSAGSVGAFGFQAPLGAKSNAKQIEKNKNKKNKKR